MSLPDIAYLVPLTEILECRIEDLLNLKRKDADNMIDNFKVVIRKNLDRNEYEKLKLMYGESWLNHTINFNNIFYGEDFFILGILNKEVVGAIHITGHPEQNDYYLISDLGIVDGYGTKEFISNMIDSSVAILKDMNCTKVGAFVGEEYKEYFEKFGFTKVSDDYQFGNDKKSTSCADPYYEVVIEQDYYCEELNEENAKHVSQLIIDKKNKYSKDIPAYFKQSSFMLKMSFIRSNDFDNEKVYVIMNGKTICGYTDMFYEEDQNLYLRIDLREECLYNDIVKTAIEQAKVYCHKIKEKIEIKTIVFYVNNSLLLEKEFTFYRKVLTINGFVSNDNVEFKLKLN